MKIKFMLLLAACLAGGASANPMQSQHLITSRETNTIEISALRMMSERSHYMLAADVAQIAETTNDKANISAYLPKGGVISGPFGTVTLTKGTADLVKLSWAGDQGAKARFQSAEANSKVSTYTTYTCSVSKRTVEVHEADGTVRNTGFVTVVIPLANGGTMTISCRTGEMRMVLSEP